VFSIINDSKVKPDVEEDRLESKPSSQAISLRISSKAAKVPVFRATKSVTKKKLAQMKTVRRTARRPKANEVILINDPKIDSKDPKLLADCNVRLTRIDPKTLHQMNNGSFDVKLYSKCFVHIKKLPAKQDQSVYCMNHGLYCCTCLGSTTNN
jgi:hypothetical protein